MTQPAYDHKYSDRDVRENPDLRDLALKYIETYGGSFEPLLRVKQFLAYHDEGELTTAQIRLVLNCMRHDSAVAADLPAPKFPFVVQKRQQIAPVIPIQRDKRSQSYREKHCGNKDPHEYHRYSTGSGYCNGTPFPINRGGEVHTSGRIRMNFAASKSGALVHKITGEANFWWSPNRHDWGFRGDTPSRFSVKLLCKNPSWLRDPHLFKQEPVHLYADEVFAKSRCPRCFTVTELREGPPPPRQGIPQVTFLAPE